MVEATPIRLQLSRAKGSSLQEASRIRNGLPAARVARPGPFGNPFAINSASEVYSCNKEAAHVHAVRWFREWLDAADELFEPCHIYQGMKTDRDKLLRKLPELRGKNLACFCGAAFACHADVLIELANAPLSDGIPHA